MEEIIGKIRKELKQNVDAETKNTAQHFFKEKVEVYGIKTAIVTRISKQYFEESARYR